MPLTKQKQFSHFCLEKLLRENNWKHNFLLLFIPEAHTSICPAADVSTREFGHFGRLGKCVQYIALLCDYIRIAQLKFTNRPIRIIRFYLHFEF